jgi:hypothetical protein
MRRAHEIVGRPTRERDPRVMDRASWARWSFVAAAVVVACAGDEAHACSGAGPGVWDRSFYPPANSHGVPTNAQIVVTYQGGGIYAIPAASASWGEDLEIRAVPAGTPVKARVTVRNELRRVVVIAKPAAPLAASTSFEILDRRTIPCDACPLGTPNVVATFETAAGPDTSPPRFAGLAKAKDDPYGVCDNSACCAFHGSYGGYGLSLEWAAGADDQPGPLHYTIYDRGPANQSGPGRPVASFLDVTTAEGIALCMGDEAPFRAFVGSLGPYLVRAVDWAGNEDANTAVAAVPGTCPSSTDAGAGDHPAPRPTGIDASAPSPSPQGALGQSRASGCSIASGPTTTRPWAQPLVWLLLVICFRNLARAGRPRAHFVRYCWATRPRAATLGGAMIPRWSPEVGMTEKSPRT